MSLSVRRPTRPPHSSGAPPTQFHFEIVHDWRGMVVPGWPGASVTVWWDTDGDLRVRCDAPRGEDPAPSAPAGRLDGLWEHEVCELFLAGPEGYIELEFGPHGHFLAYRLGPVRVVTDPALPVACTWAPASERWAVDARVGAEHLPAGPFCANAFAIVTWEGRRRYLAATPLPGETPDFHQPEHFPRLPGA